LSGEERKGRKKGVVHSGAFVFELAEPRGGKRDFLLPAQSILRVIEVCRIVVREEKMGDIGCSQLVPESEMIYTFDEVIRQRAVDEDQSPLIAYPKSKFGIPDYEVFSGKVLDQLVDGAAKALIEADVRPLVCTSFHFTTEIRIGIWLREM